MKKVLISALVVFCLVLAVSCTTNYTVKFDAAGGAPTPATQSVPAGGLVTRPETPTYSGYKFLGWYKDGVLYDFENTKVNSNFTLAAKWEATSSDVSLSVMCAGTDISTAYATDYVTFDKQVKHEAYKSYGFFVDGVYVKGYDDLSKANYFYIYDSNNEAAAAVAFNCNDNEDGYFSYVKVWLTSHYNYKVGSYLPMNGEYKVVFGEMNADNTLKTSIKEFKLECSTTKNELALNNIAPESTSSPNYDVMKNAYYLDSTTKKYVSASSISKTALYSGSTFIGTFKGTSAGIAFEGNDLYTDASGKTLFPAAGSVSIELVAGTPSADATSMSKITGYQTIKFENKSSSTVGLTIDGYTDEAGTATYDLGAYFAYPENFEFKYRELKYSSTAKKTYYEEWKKFEASSKANVNYLDSTTIKPVGTLACPTYLAGSTKVAFSFTGNDADNKGKSGQVEVAIAYKNPVTGVTEWVANFLVKGTNLGKKSST